MSAPVAGRGVRTAEPPIDRRAIASWCLYDWANSAYNTIITTFVFAVYFANGVIGDPVAGTARWSAAMTVAGVAIALLSPVLGAIADRSGRRKPWMGFFTGLTVLGSAALWWVEPDPSFALFALVCVVVATVAFELANVFYNATLPGLVPPRLLGRVSGWGWGVGYFGGLACLVVALFGFVKAEAPLFGLFGLAWSDWGPQANIRATALLVAVWYGLFALPYFLWVPDEPSSGRPLGQAVREGIGMLGRTLREAPRYGQAFRFLIASAFYRDGINTITAFGGLFAAGSFGMSFEEIVLFAIALNVVAGTGAVGFAWMDDRAGAKTVILLALAGMTAFGVPLLLATDKLWFWILALGLGAFFGPAQAAGRSMMARLAPPGMTTEMFGLYGLTGRVVGFFGPLLFGLATEAFANQRAGMATVLAFFVVGFGLMLTVREPAMPRRNAAS
ncbi:MFS transporter [Azospirillum doebereinerae]|uniref:MFS transporter n=1 Tax=Azospirillum doebereinerae TaxID=92933 RepID=UPI001EE581A3|nr:MFS transporter [Azospirillum doebereinerae]